LAEEAEFEAARTYFPVIESRLQIEPDDLIIGRYSVLPYYDELEKDIKAVGGVLVNTHQQHQFAADLKNWAPILSNYTPHSWFSLADAMKDNYEGPYILKGSTNSRKSLFKTHMFAANKIEMRDVYFRLMDDGLIGSQGVVIRKFEYFKNYGLDISGIPIAKEFRFFVFNGHIFAKGFYWASHPEIIEEFDPSPSEVPTNFLFRVVEKLAPHVNFYSLDVAQREDGIWRVIEINEGQQSGLATIDPIQFYEALLKIVDI
jgi:hypothetical protein